jgi:RNA polymerase sigma-70 factor (ECF subfamily)
MRAWFASLGTVRGRSFQESELEGLYRARYADFVRVAAGVTGDLELARDAVQEAFVSAWQKRRYFRGEGPLEAWVWRIVINAARMQARARVPEPVEPVERPGSNGAVDEEGLFDVWLAALPERQRFAIFLRYYADLDYRGIAEVLGVEVGTVSATLSAAHASLRTLLTKERL